MSSRSHGPFSNHPAIPGPKSIYLASSCFKFIEIFFVMILGIHVSHLNTSSFILRVGGKTIPLELDFFTGHQLHPPQSHQLPPLPHQEGQDPGRRKKEAWRTSRREPAGGGSSHRTCYR